MFQRPVGSLDGCQPVLLQLQDRLPGHAQTVPCRIESPSDDTHRNAAERDYGGDAGAHLTGSEHCGLAEQRISAHFSSITSVLYALASRFSSTGASSPLLCQITSPDFRS